jgi:uncharacterized membrane-anchored protein YitT (DUF2179 family)
MTVLAYVFALVALVASIIILIDAFKASVGQGFLCLCVPFYIFYYALVRLQHPQKNLILAALFGGWVLAIGLNVFTMFSGV